MENKENKKSKKGIIIVLIILILIILFAICFFLLKDKGETNNNTNQNEKTIEKESSYYDYRDGVLTPVVDREGKPKQTEFVIDGIILVGNRHEYIDRKEAMEYIEYFAKQGYKKEGINSSFFLGEYISFYIDTKYTGPNDDVKILVTPHKTVEELEKLSITKLQELALDNGGFVLDYNTPEKDNYKYVGEGYVHQDYPEGKYDILFVYQGKLAYFINITEAKETNAE